VPTDLLFAAILPELVLCSFGILIMVVDAFLDRANKSFGAAIALFGLAAAAAAARLAGRLPAGPAFSGMVTADPLGVFFRLAFYLIGALLVLAARDYLEREQLPPGEFYALLLFAIVGMDFMAIASDLVMTFIGLEILSVDTYVLAGLRRADPRSNEAGLKYFFMGACSSALLLYGIALVYGCAGTTGFAGILDYTARLRSLAEFPLLLLLGLALVLVGLCFKVSAAPFHVWTPDVYQGAPTLVTAFMSVGPKAAGFAALIRVLFQLVPADLPLWTQLLLVSSVLTMLIGNLGAIPQSNVKRMLAYSSIAHAGYILIGFVAANETGLTAVLFYAVAYALMNLGAFTVVALVGGAGDQAVELEHFRGLGFRQPLLSVPLTLCLVSLAGIPATAGFIGKFFLLGAAVREEYFSLVIIAVLASLISVYYYLRVVVYMFMQEPEESPDTPVPAAAALVVLACGGLSLFFGLFPGWLLHHARLAVVQFLGTGF